MKMLYGIEKELLTEDCQYARVIRELESIKWELGKLKLDMASILQEKRINSSGVNTSLPSSSDARKIMYEDHCAEFDTITEHGKVESPRKEISGKYYNDNEVKTKVIQEILNAEELENKMAITLSDIRILQSGLNLVKEMEERTESTENLSEHEIKLPEVGKTAFSSSLFGSVKQELEATKKELVSIKEDSSQFMASVDIVKNELKHVLDETAQLRKKEKDTEMILRNLKTELLRAKAKLEATSAAEDKVKLLVSNLSITIQQLKSEAERTKKEQSLISEENAVIKAEVQKIEVEIDLSDERMLAALQDLKAVKSSEALALENLKAQIEITMRNRTSTSRRSSTVEISKFEHDYLLGQADRAKEIADQKIAADSAWIEALKASEKEIIMKTELWRRESRELRVEEEHDQSMNVRKVVGNQPESLRHKQKQNMETESLKPEIAILRRTTMAPTKKAMSGRGLPPFHGNSRRTSAKSQGGLSPFHDTAPRTSALTMERKKELMPTLAKFLGGKGST